MASASEAALKLAKTASTGSSERLAQNALESLILATVPLPTKPVGVGAQWIAETRMPMAGLDVVANMRTVTTMTGDRVHLSLQVKGYSKSRDPSFQVSEGRRSFRSVRRLQGEMESSGVRCSPAQVRRHRVAARPWSSRPRAAPRGADPQPEQLDCAGIRPACQLAASTTAQIQSQATLVRGEDLRAAMTRP